MKPVIWFAIALVVTLTCQQTYAQITPAQTDAGITSNRVIGELKAIDSATKQITVKTDASSVVTVTLADSAGYSRIPPGEKTLDKAAKISFADLGVGDRVLAVGKVADDHKSAMAGTLVVISKGDLAKKQLAERMEWRQRGVMGVITAVKPDKREITLTTRNPLGTQAFVMTIPDKLDMRRYAPDSTKFADAKPSDFEELKVGDQVRVLGNKSADGTHVTPEKLVSGSFRMAVGPVTAVDSATGEVKIKDTQTHQELTVVVKPDSVIRRFPTMAEMAAARAAAAASAPKAGTPGQTAAKPSAPPAIPPGTVLPTIQELMDQLPRITAAELKAGDVIIVSSTKGADPSRLTAITVISGADTMLVMLASVPPGAGGQQGVPNPAAGLGSGVTFGIGLP